MNRFVGRHFHYGKSHPSGLEIKGRWVSRVINSPERLEFISSFSNASGEVSAAPFKGLENFPPEVLTSVTFFDHAGIGKGTLVTIAARPLNGTKAQRDFFTAFHPSMHQGWTGTIQQLAEFIGE